MKKYEITGVSTYAHCFSFEVEAKNIKEAIIIAKSLKSKWDDPAIAEFQEVLIDEPKLLK